MAPWELDELNECRRGVGYFSNIPLDLVERLYRLVGGIPRYVLRSPAAVLYQNKKDFDGAKEQAYMGVKFALDNVESVPVLLQYVSQAKESLDISSHLLHHWPMNDSKGYYLRWGSSHIQGSPAHNSVGCGVM